MVVTVVGLGFVGLTTALGFSEYGHKVYGIEANEARLATIKGGKLPFLEPGLDEALVRHLNKNFIPTVDWNKAVSESDFVYYCVGTPYGENGEADLTYLYGAIEQTLDAMKDKKFRVLVTKSTIPPGTTKNRIVPFTEKKGWKVGDAFGVANNPEFLREGHCWDDFINADRIVLGVSDEKSAGMLKELYANAGCPVHTVSLNTGEFIKYLSNTSLALLISYSNEMSMAADALGDIDVAKAFRILHEDKRWQTGTIRSYFYPGCGYGGYCLPKDTNAFYANAKSAGFDGQILKNVIAVNDLMPEITAKRVEKACENDTAKTIGILGLSFNPGSDDTRDTPAAKIIKKLNEDGYKKIVAYDPVATEEFKAHYNVAAEYESSVDELVVRADVLAITTAWPEFKDIKAKTGKPIVDCRYML